MSLGQVTIKLMMPASVMQLAHSSPRTAGRMHGQWQLIPWQHAWRKSRWWNFWKLQSVDDDHFKMRSIAQSLALAAVCVERMYDCDMIFIALNC